MLHQRKNFIAVKESFTCEHCGTQNTPASKTTRNHCKTCLWSKHVDDKVPGDRASLCQSLMEPYKVEGGTNRKGYSIVHRCTQCGKIIKNKVASDDDMEIIIKLAGNVANFPSL